RRLPRPSRTSRAARDDAEPGPLPGDRPEPEHGRDAPRRRASARRPARARGADAGPPPRRRRGLPPPLGFDRRLGLAPRAPRRPPRRLARRPPPGRRAAPARLRLRHRGPRLRRPALRLRGRHRRELLRRPLHAARRRGARALPAPRRESAPRRLARRPPGRRPRPRRRLLRRPRPRARARRRPVLRLLRREHRDDEHLDLLFLARSSRVSRMSRPRVLVLNQYYWPSVEATAHLLSQLCSALAEEFDVTVVTGRLRDADGPARLEREGVEIVRVPSTAFDRRRLPLRAVNYLTYLGASLAAAIAARPPDVVLCTTDPPVTGDAPLLVPPRV